MKVDQKLTREQVFRKIIEEHQYREMEGIIVDATTANMLVTIIDALSPQNKEKFLNLPLMKMVSVGWKLVK